MAEKISCPNCLGPAEKVDNKITCQACDSVFEIKRTGAANVIEVGWKEKLEGRVKATEDQIASLIGEQNEPEPELEDQQDQEEPIL